MPVTVLCTWDTKHTKTLLLELTCSEAWEAIDVCYQVTRYWLLFWLPRLYSKHPHFHWGITLPFGYSLLRLLLKVGSSLLAKPGLLFLSWDLNLQKSSKKIENSWNLFILQGLAPRQNYWVAPATQTSKSAKLSTHLWALFYRFLTVLWAIWYLPNNFPCC